jgi:hypothetical protein
MEFIFQPLVQLKHESEAYWKTHGIVYLVEILFINPQLILKVRLLFILSNWNFIPGTCTIRKSANGATSFHCWTSTRLGSIPNWLVTQKPLHQAGLAGIRAKASGEYSQPGSKPGSLVKQSGVSCSHLNQSHVPLGSGPLALETI